MRFNVFCKFAGVSDELGVVFGYAIVSTIEGEPYYDTQGDYIPPDSMMKAAVDFALSARTAGEMHERDADGAPVNRGTVVFAFPMTQPIADSLGIQIDKEGLLVGVKPDPGILEKVRSGEYTGFSIGGERIGDTDVDVDE